MNFNPIQDNIPESKSRVLNTPVITNEHKQLIEDGPDKIKVKKISPLRKFFNNLWEPFHG